MIGVAVKGKPIGGVIHEPYYRDPLDDKKLGRTVWGVVGYGVGGFKPKSPPAKGLVVITTRTNITKVIEKSIEVLNPDKVLNVGGAGCKVIRIVVM